jgi:restriction system protein
VDIPKVYELCNPTLKAIRVLGGRGSTLEIGKAVIRGMRLPEEIVQQPHGIGPETELEYRLAWARTILKAAELIANSSNGAWVLTQKGSSSATVNPEEIRDFYSGDKVPQDNEAFWNALEDDLWDRFGAEQFLSEYSEADAEDHSPG